MMMGLSLAIPALAARGQGQWWRGIYDVESISGGTISPGLITDLIRRRYALPMSLTPEQILAASAADVAAAVRACAVSDVLDFSRPSVATYVDDAGVMHTVAANMPRITPQGLLLEGAAQNLVNNAEFIGGAVGAIPSGWVFNLTTSGLSLSIAGAGTEDGRRYVDVRFAGVLANTNIVYPCFNLAGAARPAAAVGETHCFSAEYKLVGGALPPAVHELTFQLQETNSGGTLASSVTRVFPNSSRQKVAITRVLSSSSVTNLNVGFYMRAVESVGTEIDFTVRLYCPQLEKASTPSSYIPTTGSVMTRAADWCRLTPRARAVLARASAGMIVQGAAIQGSNGRIVGGRDSRVVGLNIPQTAMQLGDINVVAIGAAATPTPAYGLAAGWDAAGKAGSYQSAPVASHGLPLDADLSELYLGRDSVGTYANGYIQALIGYAERPANAALPGKAIPYV